MNKRVKIGQKSIHFRFDHGVIDFHLPGNRVITLKPWQIDDIQYHHSDELDGIANWVIDSEEGRFLMPESADMQFNQSDKEVVIWRLIGDMRLTVEGQS